MATVTGFTAERMLEIEGSTVVSGSINELGSLILVRRDGTPIDAGSSVPVVPIADNTTAGRVELATSDETIAGTNGQLAVTPAGLAALPGYKLQQTVRFTSSGSFTKASYPNLKAIRIRVVGGGGGGGNCGLATTGNHSAGGGGGGGGYAESLVLAADLATSETVTVGAGGGGSGSGGVSSFGSKASATGGIRGGFFNDSPLMIGAVGGLGGVGTIGDFKSSGAPGGTGSGYGTLGHGGIGGSSVLGGGAAGTYSSGGADANAGTAGRVYGGGGSGAACNAAAIGGASGGSGAAGIVIVEVYV